MLGVVWDGALRGVHRDALAKAGLLAINKQHGGLAPEKLPDVRGKACYHNLYAADGRVTECTVTDDGTAEYRPVPVTRLEQRKDSSASRWYHVLAIPCVRGVTHIHRVRLDQNEEDTKRKFDTAEHLRQIPPGTATFDRIYGHRPDSESLNATLDATWWNKGSSPTVRNARRSRSWASPRSRTRSHATATSLAGGTRDHRRIAALAPQPARPHRHERARQTRFKI